MVFSLSQLLPANLKLQKAERVLRPSLQFSNSLSIEASSVQIRIALL